MGGSCINREVENLDVYRRGWQVLSLDEALTSAESGFFFRDEICVHVQWGCHFLFGCSFERWMKSSYLSCNDLFKI